MLRKISTIILILSAFVPKMALAVVNDISGTYSGTITFNDFDSTPGPCPTNGLSGSGTLTITLIGDDQGNISGGSGQFVNNLAGDTDTITGIFGSNDNTTFSVSLSSSDGGGGIAGSFSSSAITNLSGSVAGMDCISNITGGTLTRTDSGNVVSTDTSSSTVTDLVLFNTQIQGTIGDLSARIGNALGSLRGFIKPVITDNQFKLQGMTGLNAGDNSIPYGIWGNYSYTDYKNDLSTTAFDGSSHNFLGGIDFNLWENSIVGIALGYEIGNIDTNFNNGNQKTNSFTIAPYFGVVLDDVLSFDVNVGYSRVSYDQFRTTGTTRVTSSPNSNRTFGAFNLNAIKFIDNWVIGGRIGALFARSSIEQFTESNGAVVAKSSARVGTFSIASDIAYTYNQFEPFINLAYNYDFSLEQVTTSANPQPTNDPNDLLMTAGVRFFNESGLTGNLEYSKRFLRDNLDEDRISLTIRADF